VVRIVNTQMTATVGEEDQILSLVHLLRADVLADPYPLYHRLRREDPVHWDPYLHAWVVTRYADVVTVFTDSRYSANRTPSPDQLRALGLGALSPLAHLMVKQMLFLDQPAHGRIRGLASKAFTPRHVERLREHIQDIVNDLLDTVMPTGQMDVIADLGFPLPAIVVEEVLGLPISDREQLKQWTADFAEVLGNFQHNPDRAPAVLRSVNEMTAYFQSALEQHRHHHGDDLMCALLNAEIDGDRLSDEEVVANTIVTMVGGQETTTNLIGNGVLALLRNPQELARLRADLTMIPSAVEELLRYESPSQQTARMCVADTELGGKQIRARQAVVAVMAAANRDPERFPEPDRLDVGRQDNRHVAFAWGPHFCLGAPLARLEAQIAFETLLRRMPVLQLTPAPLVWRQNLGLRGLLRLPITFSTSVGSPVMSGAQSDGTS
jgi:cytochrome P450